MFLAQGTAPEDFLNGGATLYTTLEPCPYCASGLLVSRMKRVCYVIPDKKYGGAWRTLKASYYSGDDTTYLPMLVDGTVSPFAGSVASLLGHIFDKVEALRKQGVRDTLFLDSCRGELEAAFNLLRETRPADLSSVGASEARNATTLAGLQRALGMAVMLPPPSTNADRLARK